MGMLPEEAVEHGFSGPTIGMECAGRIARVGANVTDFKARRSRGGFCVRLLWQPCDDGRRRGCALFPMIWIWPQRPRFPPRFSQPITPLIIWRASKPGETVLIHGAAGGVGMAAIQIAKLKGAKVIGTAGSARKRRMLEMLGVDHVLNSRSLEFADEVMKITGGVGVDVVLNSLAGEAITKSLQCLRPFGRFLEIGKRDLYGNSQIGLRPFRNNLSYFGIDADTLDRRARGAGTHYFQEGDCSFCCRRIAPSAVPGDTGFARGGSVPRHATIAPCRQACGVHASR